MEDKIEIGDTVKVLFSTHPPITGIVKHKPQATGDAWVIKPFGIEVTGDEIVYIQQYDYILRQYKAKEQP